MVSLLSVRSIFAGRFEIEHEVDAVGMAQVYRAIDLTTQQPVALKVMGFAMQPAIMPNGRFREVELLASLSHPSIVRYVTHGETPEGLRYLATEWLEGEDLAQRLQRHPLTLSECLRLLRRVVKALAVVHGSGIIHGDIKSANLFLRDGLADRVTLLDFGIARSISGPSRGHFSADHRRLAGTLNYLAPELARGDAQVSPGVDIFSLGCVLFESLTGQLPFSAEHTSAVLARILFDEPPSLRRMGVEVPASVERLLRRMLAKQPENRPADGAALLVELEDIEGLLDQAELGEETPPPTLTSGEQRLATVVVAQSPVLMGEHSFLSSESTAFLENLRGVIAPWGGQLERLADGTLMISLAKVVSNEATDQAEQAVRCALLIKERWKLACVVITTGRERVGNRTLMGEAVDRAMRLLTDGETDGRTRAILLDDVTAGLLETLFEVLPIGDGRYMLTAEIERLDRTRLLLGKPTPCVGREHDLSLLESTLAQCSEHSTARIVLVSAAPGMGKSRLRHEFLRRIQGRSSALRVLQGRGDLMSVGSPYQAIAHALRRLCGISEGEDVSVQRAKLLQQMQRRLPAADAQRVAVFLGELCSIGLPEDQPPLLTGARQNPRTMSMQVSEAWVDLLSKETEQHAVLLLLEDFHWGDALSVGLLHTALRELEDRPLMVVVFGRPEMEDLFPSLWQEHNVRVLRLGRLSKKASERLARHTLGEEVSQPLVGRIVQQAEGNPLYLEELIRTVAEGSRDALPETLLAMLESRLMRLEAVMRRVLRAASIFGDVFDSDGLRELLGRQNASEAVERWLQWLLAAELIERSVDQHRDGAARFRFRHALVREAAYDLLTPDDRLLGHRLAAQYLVSTGVREPRILAEHYRRGGQPEQAAVHYLAAAERALGNSDLDGALESAERGVACGVSGTLRGELRGVQVQAYFWRDDWQLLLPVGREAMRLLAPETDCWSRTAAVLLPTTALTGDIEGFSALASQIPQIKPLDCARVAYFQAAAHLLVMWSLLGQREPALGLLSRLASEIDAADLGLVEQGYYKFGKLVYSRSLCSDPWKNYVLAEAATRITATGGDLRTLLFVQGFLGTALGELGRFEDAESVLRECMELAQRLNEPLLNNHVRVQYELVLLIGADPARLQEALISAQCTVDNERTNPLLRGEALINLAAALQRTGQLTQAETAVRSARGLLSQVPADHVLATSVLVGILAGQGRHVECAQAIQTELETIRRLEAGGYAALTFYCCAAEAYLAAGDTPAARACIVEANTLLLQRAQTIKDPAMRDSFLNRVQSQVRIQELARLWLD